MSPHDRVARIEASLARLLTDASESARWSCRAPEGVPPALGGHALDSRRADLPALTAAIHERLATRRNRGVGSLSDRFPTALAEWTRQHPDDAHAHSLVARFAASSHGQRWRPVTWRSVGPCLEEAFCDFVVSIGLVPAAAMRREMLYAVGRALVTCPDPLFVPPHEFVGRAGHWLAVVPGDPPEVVAAIGDQLITGAITPLIAETLVQPPHSDTPAHARMRSELSQRGLIPADCRTLSKACSNPLQSS